MSLYSLEKSSTFLEGAQALLQLFLSGLVGGSSQHVGLQLLHLKLQVSFLISQTLKEGEKDTCMSGTLSC